MRLFSKLLLALLLIALPAHAVEALQGVVSFILANNFSGGNTAPGVSGQASDFNATGLFQVVRVCADDHTRGCTSGNFQDVVANCDFNIKGPCTGTNHFWHFQPGVDGSPVGQLGSVNLINGSQHTLDFWVRSTASPGTGDLHVDNWPSVFTFTWDTVRNNFLAYDVPNVSSASPADLSQMVVMVNRADPYSIGVSASDYCVISSGAGVDHIKIDGAAGKFGAAHAIPCDADHFIVSTMAVQPLITPAAFITAWGAGCTVCSRALLATAATVQYPAIAWYGPSVVTTATTFDDIEPVGLKLTGYSMTAWVTMFPTSLGVEPSYTKCIGKPNGVGKALDNPWYNSGTNANPRAMGVMPAMMLAAGSCPTSNTNPPPGPHPTPYCSATDGAGTWVADFPKISAVIDAAVLAKGTNPAGTAQVLYCWVSGSSTCNITSENLGMTPASLGTGLSPMFTYIRLGTPTSPANADVSSSGIKTNALYYHESANTWRFDAAPNILNAVPGAGLATALGSVTGYLFGTRSQVPSVAWLSTTTGGATGVPFVAAGGTAIEPCESVYLKGLRSNLYISYISAGWNMAQAVWKSQPDPWNWQLVGDPMAQPFQPPLPPARPTWFMVHRGGSPIGFIPAGLFLLSLVAIVRKA